MTKSNNPNASKKQDDTHFEPVEQGAHSAGKPIEPKEGSGFHCGRKVPKSSPVTTVSPDTNKNKAIEVAEKQNTSSDGKINQQPSGKNFPSRVKPE